MLRHNLRKMVANGRLEQGRLDQQEQVRQGPYLLDDGLRQFGIPLSVPEHNSVSIYSAVNRSPEQVSCCNQGHDVPWRAELREALR